MEESAEVAHVRAIVREEAARFAAWHSQLQVTPTIVALAERAEQTRRAALAKSRLRQSLSAEQSEQLDALTRALVKQLLHDPLTTLRERGDRAQHVEAVRALFRLDEPAPLDGAAQAALEA